MAKKILFYATYGGYGHIARDFGIAKYLTDNCEVHVASGMNCPFQTPNIEFHKLPEIPAIFCLDKPIRFTEFYSGTEGPKQYRQHMLEFIQLANKLDPDLIVIDVTAEFAIYSKMMGFKTAMVYITGRRDDLRHQVAYSSVDNILVPYPEGFTDVSYLPGEVRKKMFFSGGFSRFDGDQRLSNEEAKQKIGLKKDNFLIICSAGKGDFAQRLYKIFEDITGDLSDITSVTLKGSEPEKQVKLYLSAADLAITGAGDNTVMENCYYQIPMIVVPLERPYCEQLIKAENLEKFGIPYIDGKRLNKSNLMDLINRIKMNEKLQLKMRQSESKIVDGKGAWRMANFLEELVN